MFSRHKVNAKPLASLQVGCSGLEELFAVRLEVVYAVDEHQWFAPMPLPLLCPFMNSCIASKLLYELFETPTPTRCSLFELQWIAPTPLPPCAKAGRPAARSLHVSAPAK
jgi:hypothetical protein